MNGKILGIAMLIALFFLFMAIPRERRRTECMGVWHPPIGRAGLRKLQTGRTSGQTGTLLALGLGCVAYASRLVMHASTTLPNIGADPGTLT